MIRHRVILGFAAVGLLTFASCSSDKKLVLKPAATEATTRVTSGTAGSGTPAGDGSSSAGVATVPDASAETVATDNSSATDGTTDTTDSGSSADTVGTFPPLPAGSSADCAALYGKLVAAMGGVTGGTDGMTNLAAAMKAIRSEVPDELKADVDTLSEAYAKLADIMAKFGGDMTKAMSDPAAAEAFSELSNPKFEAASTALSNYFDKTCPTLSQS
jgi:hypothetical protein